MRSRTVAVASLLFLASLFEARLPAFAQAASTRSAFVRSAFVPVASDSASETASDLGSASELQKLFFGVMGQVAHPGVYELSTAKPKLTSIIGRAGGLTASASRTVRVVRNGHVAFQTYYTPRLTLTLLPGDLLLVDGDRTNYRHGNNVVRPAGRIDTRTSQSRSTVDSQTVDSQTVDSQIEVAFVGLIGRPVVLRLRARDATVGRVVQLLKQPVDVIPAIRLISPARSRLRIPSTSLTSQTPLHSGTVLIFSRTHLDPATIPPLPTPIRRATPPSAPPAIERSTSGNSDFPVGRRAKISQDGKRKNRYIPPIGQTGIIPTSGEESATIPEDHGAGDLSMRRSPVRHSAVTLSKRNVPHRLSQIAPPNFASLPDEDNLFSEKPVPNPNAMDATSLMTTGPETTAPKAAAASESNRSEASGLVLLFVLGCGVLAVGLASMFLISMARTGMKTTHRKQRKASPRIDDDRALEALIRNEIAICEEEIELPEKLTLHGRSTGLRKLRIDSGREQLRGPHFSVPAGKTATADKTADRTNTTDTKNTTPAAAGLRVDPPQKATKKTTRVETVRRRRGPLRQPQHKSAQRDLLDRVLSTVNKVTDE